MPSRALPKSLYSRPPIGHPYNFRSQMVVIGIGEENPSRDIVGSFSERISAWFRTNIGEPTELQERSWRAIRNGRNVLIISPTGSGKTLAAVLPPVDDILTGRSKRSLTSILYVSPMKALGADLMRTLEGLSTGLGRIPGKKERKRGRVSSRFPPKDAPLEIGIRTGDVPQGV
ncbi:MAG TPA: DEAD/DEAH box helicase, partial [Euryarchaeota archaeon]|nr:DEAD/DEAH box helicase [Euryarchaeota archaeon]